MTRILLSALAARHGGGITYLRNIVRTFPDGPDVRLSVLAHESFESLPTQANVEWIKAPRWSEPPILRFLFGFVYFRFFWPRRRDFDLVFCASGSFDVSLPGDVTRVVAFHNMLPFDGDSRRLYRPGWLRLRFLLLRLVQGWALRRADFVIFISDHGRRAIDRVLGGRRGGATVIRHGVSRGEAPLDPGLACRLPERFLLYLSTIHPYKAHLELIEAWSLLRSRGPMREKLVLAGPDHPPYVRRLRRAIARHGLEKDVILLGPVPHEQVFDLARRSLANLFLSVCENCPLILLELMSVGRPLLISSRQPMPELGGAELHYVDPFDVPGVATAIADLVADAAARRRLGAAAARRAQMFSWEQCGAATWEALRAAQDQTAPRPALNPGEPLAATR